MKPSLSQIETVKCCRGLIVARPNGDTWRFLFVRMIMSARNILDKTDKSLAPTPSKDGKTAPTPKRDKFDWSTGGGQGRFELVAKARLNIDGRYQRDATSSNKILEIARNWDWLFFGTLSVIEREDLSLWVFDGGHRTRASFYRDDIIALPCMIHAISEVSDEAKAFVGRNTMVSNVSAIDRHKASLCAGEPIAAKVQSMLDDFGLKVVARGSQAADELSCIATVTTMMRQDEGLARKCIEFAMRMSLDEHISAGMLRGLFCLCRRFYDVDIIRTYGDSLAKYSLAELEKKMRQKRAELGQGGEKTEALALLDLINKGRRNRMSW